jgi:hypothetical protein
MIHVVDPRLSGDHRDRLTDIGIDVTAAEASGQFKLRNWTDSYLRDGRFDKNRMLASVQKLVDGSRQLGYDKLHLTGNMGWALKAHTSRDDLIEYEASVNEIWPDDGDAAFCVYDLTKFDAVTIVGIIRTHPLVMIGGVIRENPHYLLSE